MRYVCAEVGKAKERWIKKKEGQQSCEFRPVLCHKHTCESYIKQWKIL